MFEHAGNDDVTEKLVRIACGQGDMVQDQIYSDIDVISERVDRAIEKKMKK